MNDKQGSNLIVSTNQLEKILQNLDEYEIILYNFESSNIIDHYILSLSYDNYMVWKEFNFDYIVIYDKNQRAFNTISEVSNENWNLLKVVYDFQKTNTNSQYDLDKENQLNKLYSKRTSFKTNFIGSDKLKEIDKSIEELEKYKYSTEFSDRKPILNVEDVVSSIIKKLQNLYEDNDSEMSEDELFFFKNNPDAIFYIYSIEIEEEIELVKHRIDKFRKSPQYIKNIELTNKQEYYDYTRENFLNIDKAEFHNRFKEIREELYSKKIETIVDKRKTRETSRLDILDNLFKLKLIEFYELYHLYQVDKDNITSNFRQNKFTKKSEQIILKYLKLQNVDKIDTQQFYNVYERKILSLQKKKILSSEETQELQYRDYEYIINPTNKDYVIENLISINDNEKRSKGIYTKLIREFLFVNLYKLEYDYPNNYTSYKIEKFDLFKQQKKRDVYTMTVENVRADLYEYIEELIWELESAIEEERQLLSFQFGDIPSIEDKYEEARYSNTEVFVFRVKGVPTIDEYMTTSQLLQTIKNIENSNIKNCYEYSQPYKIN